MGSSNKIGRGEKEKGTSKKSRASNKIVLLVSQVSRVWKLILHLSHPPTGVTSVSGIREYVNNQSYRFFSRPFKLLIQSLKTQFILTRAKYDPERQGDEIERNCFSFCFCREDQQGLFLTIHLTRLELGFFLFISLVIQRNSLVCSFVSGRKPKQPIK